METGSKNIKTSNLLKDSSLDGNRIKQTHTVFNLRHDGLSIVVSDSSKKNILATGDYYWDSHLPIESKIRELEAIILKSELNFDDGLSVNWYLSEKGMCLIPLELYEEGKDKSFLKYTTRFSSEESYKCEVWQKHHIVCCYSLPKVLDEWLNFNYPQSEKRHHSKAFTDLYNHFPQYGNYTHLHVEQAYAELLICNEGRVIMFNQFEYKVAEDLLYFLLFAFEQSRILAPEVEMNLSGKLKNINQLSTLLENYVGKVINSELPKSFTLSSQINSSEIRKAFTLLGGL